jgi:hypothetical protein
MKRSHDETTEQTEQYTTDEIIAIVQTIVGQSGTQKEKHRIFRKSFPEFVEKYPMLFQMACEPDFNMERLVYMLRMRDAVNQQNVSQHQASVSVGENLFQEYVKPLVDSTNPKK